MSKPIQDEAKRYPYEKMLQYCLRGELRIVNAGLPQSQKRLSDLLNEKYPNVICNDGSTHFFKKTELEYLAGMVDAEEQKELLLPMILALGANQAEATISILSGCEGKVEEKIASKVLNMPVTCDEASIRIYKPQLALLRRKLKTTTVYVFSPKIVT